MWKFHDFSITQILREINFGGSKSAKCAILTHLEAQNFDFCEIFALSKGQLAKIANFRPPKIAKKAFLQNQDSRKLFSRKIRPTEKSLNFHNNMLR